METVEQVTEQATLEQIANIENVVVALQTSKVIAYPTEGVFGVGCDPDDLSAIQNLLNLKQRPVSKGLILIAASYEQLAPYIDDSQLSDIQLEHIHATWPGPYTWVMPASDKVTPWLRGDFDSIAVRVSAHPLVQKLCLAYGKPITSTSANLTGQKPCMTSEQVIEQLGNESVVLLDGKTSGRLRPSEIRDAKTGQVLRQG